MDYNAYLHAEDPLLYGCSDNVFDTVGRDYRGHGLSWTLSAILMASWSRNSQGVRHVQTFEGQCSRRASHCQKLLRIHASLPGLFDRTKVLHGRNNGLFLPHGPVLRERHMCHSEDNDPFVQDEPHGTGPGLFLLCIRRLWILTTAMDAGKPRKRKLCEENKPAGALLFDRL